jgi:hypothetical protein
VCPECGRPFDRETVVLYGYARGSSANAGNARPWTAVLLVLLPAVNLLNLCVNPSSSRAIAVAFLSLWIAFVVWIFVRRRQTEAPGLILVHLTPAGCRQFDADRARDALDRPPAPWADIQDVEVGQVSDDRFGIKLLAHAPWGQLERARVDAEVRGGPEHLAALRTRIEQWRGPSMTSRGG